MEQHDLEARLTAAAGLLLGHGHKDSSAAVLDAIGRLLAAEAENVGGREAFGAVVDQKRELEVKLKRTQENHRGTLDMLGRWRELLDVLHSERPDDIRLIRARAGEHPLRPAPYERQ